MRFEFILPDRIIFGEGAAAEVGREARRLGGSLALLVTTPGAEGRGTAALVARHLEVAGLGCRTFSGVEPEPPVEDVARCCEAARGHGCDIMVGLGGGSVLDVAKKAAAELGLRRIMLPTTSGSGSEVTHESVLKVEGKKRAFVDESLTPDVAIVDPELSRTMPPALVAFSGADAIAHAVECHGSRRSNPVVRALAWQAYEMMRQSLEAAIGGDMAARARMALGSLMAGMAFANSGTTLGHALSYPLSNRRVPHGRAVAMALPYVLEFNGADPAFAAPLKRVLQLAGAVWEPDWDIAAMTDEVMTDTRHLANNPRDVTPADVRRILEQMAADFAPGRSS